MTGDLIERGHWKRRIRVESPGVLSGSIKAWHVREFVKAMDEAGIPDDAEVVAHKAYDTLHTVRLTAFREDIVEVEPVTDAALGPKPKPKRVDWTDVAYDEGDEAP